MKKFFFISILFAATIDYTFFSCKQKKDPPEKEIAQQLVQQVNDFVSACNRLQSAAESNADETQLQQIFLDARSAYKSFEWAAEYFVPSTSRFVNGPPVQEVELSGQVIEPAGLQ